LYQIFISSLDDLIKKSLPSGITSPSLEQPYVIDHFISQSVSRPALDILNTVCDSNIVLIVTLLPVVHYRTSYKITGLSAFLQLIRIDIRTQLHSKHFIFKVK